ncbi:ATP-binding protein [Marinilactibacillus sp. Marseille-P9653]|nr:ATP-binding protein [Marinilactibacillus sp. Marseille-P9653]
MDSILAKYRRQQAILDRLLHRVEVIQMNEESYRMKHRENIFD